MSETGERMGPVSRTYLVMSLFPASSCLSYCLQDEDLGIFYALFVCGQHKFLSNTHVILSTSTAVDPPAVGESIKAPSRPWPKYSKPDPEESTETSSNATAAHATAGEEAEARKSNHNGESNKAPSHPLPKHSQPDPEKSTERSRNDTAAQATAEEEAKMGESNHDVDDDGTADDSTIDVEEVWDDEWATNTKTAAQQVSADDESVEQKGSDASNSEGLDSSFDDKLDDIFADAKKDLADATNDIVNKGSDARADGVGDEDAKIKPNTSKTKQKRVYKKKSTSFSRNYKMPSRSASHSRTDQRYSDSDGLHEKTAPINSSSEQDINSAQEKTARAPGGLDEQSRIKTRRVVVNDEQANPL